MIKQLLLNYIYNKAEDKEKKHDKLKISFCFQIKLDISL